MTTFTGTAGDNSIVGSSSADFIDVSQGGEDTVIANGGGDIINMGAALDAGDRLDGGPGNDLVVLDGDYSAGLQLDAATMINIEAISLTGGHSYALTFAEGNVPDGAGLSISTQDFTQADHLKLDLQAIDDDNFETIFLAAGGSTVLGGAGMESIDVAGGVVGHAQIAAGAGDDSVFFHRALAHIDHVDGGDGSDTVTLAVSQDLVFTSQMLKNVETLTLIGAYDITMSDGNLKAGQTMTVNGDGDQAMTFDGSHEKSGAFEVIGGSEGDAITGGGGEDALSGGGGDDTLIGGKGGDELAGDEGSDSFVYTKLSDSGHKHQFDIIDDLASGDHLDLSAIDANTTLGGDQAFHVTTKFHGVAGELVLKYDAGTDLTTLSVDVNGDRKADLTLHIVGDHTGFDGLVL